MRTSPPLPPTGQRDSRVLIFSQRRLQQTLWHVTQYEFEDVVAAIDDVDLLAPAPAPRPEWSRRARRAGNAAARAVGRSRPWVPSHLADSARTPVTADHDLFFAVFHYAFQLPYLHRIPGWRRRSRRAACMIVEMWDADLEDQADALALLADFDVVYVFNPRMVRALTERGLRNVAFLPTAVDAPAFSPLPALPRRVVDCYSYGRSSSEVTHRALLRLVEDEGLTYLYDTTNGRAFVRDHRQHRALIANTMKRSDFAITYTVGDSAARDPHAEQLISTRYFEGAAGGAVMLGSRPRLAAFDECFDWPDVVVDIPFECEHVGEVMADLRGQPERLAQARHRNVRNSLLRHDWSHRWQRILADNGLAPGPLHEQRLSRLAEQAAGLSPELLDPPRRSRRHLRAGAGAAPAGAARGCAGTGSGRGAPVTA